MFSILLSASEGNREQWHLWFSYFSLKIETECLTKTKNWSGRHEVAETSGRLHPLWPQDKRLHTPRNTDYRHTRQDRWIQTELVSTLAKNATKPNPFEIILLQTTRKENNWKTEETLERAVVTLETERIKGPNPWCLWWQFYVQSIFLKILPFIKYSDTSANEDNSFRNHIR